MGLGVQAKVFHIGRRTSMGERMADALSKGKLEEVEQEMPGQGMYLPGLVGYCLTGLPTRG